MKKFKIIPLSEEYARKIRENQKDDFGNEIIEQIATGKGPCRVSLKPFSVGEDTRLLLSHSPFKINNAFDQPGPIFIQKKEVEAYKDIYRFPPEIKADKESFPLTLIGYSKEQKMVFTRLVGDDDIDLLIPQIFEEKEAVDYLHVRNAKACCFICKVERVPIHFSKSPSDWSTPL
ncbi:MAG TPA: DUF1203 domain-containing protein [Puia sp.]|nr:DUF1203 domain-containing protein [Puia sp.]